MTTELSWLNDVVERTMLLIILLTMLFSIVVTTTVVETARSNIDRTMLFAVVIIIAQPC